MTRTRTYSQTDLAVAAESGHWNGTPHEDPLNVAAVRAKNSAESRGASPKSATATEPTQLLEGESVD